MVKKLQYTQLYITISKFFSLSLCRMLPIFSLLLMLIVETQGGTSESVIFHPVDKIQASKSSWIMTTAIDFSPYEKAIRSTRNYAYQVKMSLHSFYDIFSNEDPRYIHLLNQTMHDIDSTITEIIAMNTEASNLIGHIHNHNRNKRSLLPLGGLLGFLFGTADQSDLNELKDDVRQLYANQVDQTEVLNEIVSITNISRGLINENINKINSIIDTILNINETIEGITKQLKPLFTARRFQFLHSEFLIHHHRIKDLNKQMASDLALIRAYLETHITGKLTSKIVDPAHLRKELLAIQKQLPPQIHLPENPTDNIWHYYKYLTVTPISHKDSLVLMVRIPLVDSDSQMTLYRVYNFPIYNQDIGKALIYKLEGNNLAVTKDNKYVTVLTDAEFLQCTLANGHFCNLPSALYNIDYSGLCLAALYLKQNNRIEQNCHLTVSNITGPQATYLDKGTWAISLESVTTMEIRCTEHTHVKTLQPPLTFINL